MTIKLETLSLPKGYNGFIFYLGKYVEHKLYYFGPVLKYTE
jgi:hypothetical protein